MRARRFLAAMIIFIVAVLGTLFSTIAAAEDVLISNVFVESDLRQAIEDVSAQSGINIIADQSVQGVVTVGLQNVSVDAALEMLLAGTGYLVEKAENYYLVYSADETADGFRGVADTEVVRVRNVPGVTARSLLSSSLQRYVRVDEASDTLVVTAPPEILRRIQADLRLIDVPPETDLEFLPLTYVKAAALRDLLPESLKRYVKIDAERNTLAILAPPSVRPRLLQQVAELDVPRRAGSFNVPDVHRTHLVKLNYANATAALALLPATVQEFVRADPETNSLAVSAPDVLLANIVRDIDAIDVPRRHIMLNARVVVLDRADLLDFGGEWKWPTLTAGTMVSDTTKWPWELRVGYTQGREFTNALALSLNLLSQNNEATIVANPQVLAQDGKESEIRVTTEEYFQITANSANIVRAELEKIETGTILKITPQIGRNGELTLQMEIEVSDVVARGEQNLPVVSRRSTHSTVQLQDGGTAAVAGLVDTRSQLGDKGVPGMSSVPLLGRAFRTESLNHQAKQVAVFVTATIVRDGDEKFADGGRAPAAVSISKSDDAMYRMELQSALNKLLQAGGQ
jgi:type II secretory pathway component GspD/PulD (secretin)